MPLVIFFKPFHPKTCLFRPIYDNLYTIFYIYTRILSACAQLKTAFYTI